LFVLTIDSREQKPLEFREIVFDKIEVRRVPVGDYWASLDDKEIPLCFERKPRGDLFGTMTSGHKRVYFSEYKFTRGLF